MDRKPSERTDCCDVEFCTGEYGCVRAMLLANQELNFSASENDALCTAGHQFLDLAEIQSRRGSEQGNSHNIGTIYNWHTNWVKSRRSM